MLNQTISLGDFMVTLEESDPLYSVLKTFKSEDQVMPHAALEIHHDLIANQIIRYKDSQKVSPSFYKGPLLLKHSSPKGDKVLIIASDKHQYLQAKGAFLVYTEAQGILENQHNSSLVIYADHPEFMTHVQAFFNEEKSAGSLQRSIDQDAYGSFEGLIALAQREGSDLVDQVYERMSDETKEAVIHQSIFHWFLLKKLVYVQTMMNTKLLRNECQGESKQLRHLAKAHADSIPFIMFSELWRHQKSA